MKPKVRASRYVGRLVERWKKNGKNIEPFEEMQELEQEFRFAAHGAEHKALRLMRCSYCTKAQRAHIVEAAKKN